MNRNETEIEALKMHQEINKFARNCHSAKRLKQIIVFALEAYLNFPNIEEAFYYSFNEDKLEFDYTASLPDDSYQPELLDVLMKSGILTKALNSNNIIFDHDLSLNKSFGIARFLISNKVNGLLILKIDECPLNLSILGMEYLTSLTMIFNSILNEFLYKEKLKHSQDLIDQFVASRTIEIEKLKISSDEKFTLMSSNLIHAIPHEVRTPINQILGLANFIIRHYLDKGVNNSDEIRELVDDIIHSSVRLKRLFENYVFYSNLVLISNDIRRIDEIRMHITSSASSFVEEIIKSMLYESNRDEDVEINVINAPISIEETYFVKIVREIMDNALKYSAKGQKILVSSYIESNYYYLSFTDYGVGLESDMVDNIGTYVQFDRNTMEQQGIGLGLAIVSKILSLHKGSLNIESKKGEFTKVTTKIPVASISNY